MSQLVLQVLGFPELRIDDRAGALTLRKALALLIYLVEAKGPVARDSAATLLWPEADTQTAHTRLRRLLHRIESAIGRRVIEADRMSLCLATGIEPHVDSRVFETACDRGDFEQACRIYRGDFLDGFHLESPVFDDWAFFRREALRGRLINALERLVLLKTARCEYAASAEFAARLVGLDPLSEVYARYLMRSALLAGDRSRAERCYAALVQRLRDDLGIEPEAETKELLRSFGSFVAPQSTQYALGAGVHLAYQIHGNGEPDILVMPGFVSSVERLWELPACRSFLAAVMTMGRLILFDPRGIGLSDRGWPPSPDGTLEDMVTVLRAAHSRRVVLVAASQSAGPCIKFAVEHPDRVAGLVLIGALAKGCRTPDYPFALSADQFDAWRQRLIAGWGGPIGIETFAPSLANDGQARAWWAGLLRAASSPGALKAVLEAMRDVDVTPMLARVLVPTLVLHRRGDRAVRIEAGRFVAARIPGCRLIELEGSDHWFFSGAQEPMLDALREFVTGLGSKRVSMNRRSVPLR